MRRSPQKLRRSTGLQPVFARWLRTSTRPRVANPCYILLASLIAIATSHAAADEPPNFEDHVLPIFRQHCNNCHNPDKKKAGLDLTSVAGILAGSDGGDVARAGTPDSSVLYQAINHEEGFEPMPPKKPKLDAEKLAVVHSWIAGGMIANAGGESGLREVSFDLSAGSAERPDVVAVPSNLPPASSKTAPALAVAASPWADVFAVAGHREVRLYAPASPAAGAPDFVPVASDALLKRLSFDQDGSREGIVGLAFEAGEKRMPIHAADSPPDLSGGFTISTWLYPKTREEMPQQSHFFGHDLFNLYLEAGRNGWKVRLFFRDQDRRISHLARQGEIRTDRWNHFALTFDRKEFVVFKNGEEVSRQAVSPEFKSFHPSDSGAPLTVGGAIGKPGENYKGGIDDFRLYSRALAAGEIAKIIGNAQAKLGVVGAVPFELGAIHQLRFSPNGQLLLAAGGRGAHSGAVNLYDVATGKLQATVGDEQDIVLAADISSDHRLVALGGPGRSVKIHATSDGALRHRIEKHTDWVTAVRFSPDGKQLATGDRNGGVHVWEAANGGIVYSLSEHKAAITDIAWRPDGEVLATTGEDGKLVLWSMKDGFPLRAVKAHEQKTTDRYTRLTGALDVAYLSDGGLFTSGRDRALRLWKTDGKKAKDIPELPALPLSAAVTHDGTRALTGHLDGRVMVWDLVTGKAQELPR